MAGGKTAARVVIEDCGELMCLPTWPRCNTAGHYGVVKVGVQRGTGLKVAVKTITKGKIRNVDIIRNEVRILRVR